MPDAELLSGGAAEMGGDAEPKLENINRLLKWQIKIEFIKSCENLFWGRTVRC